jgi:hypothetical protein
MLRISQSPWAACKLGLQMNSSQQRFLNKEKRASVKNSNTEAGPVPFALFDQNSTARRAKSDMKKLTKFKNFIFLQCWMFSFEG